MTEAMKFGVVEYTSKSGTVWRHSPEKPNWLADPATEIDPTSFGCYVSALAGEHIPLKGLILGPVAPVGAPKQLYRRLIKKVSGSWPNYGIDYLLSFDVLMVVHQLADAHEMVNLIEKLKQHTQRPIIVGVPTQPYGLLRSAVEADEGARDTLRQFIRACDIFISVVKDTVPWYEELSDRRIEYVPQPYPVTFASQKYTPLEDKKPVLFIAGVTQRDTIVQGHEVARELQQRFPEYEIHIPKVAAYEYDTSRLANTGYRQLDFEPWHEHLTTLGHSRLVINTDYTKTRGRVQVDCAAVGTPSLGGNSDGTRDLFPDLASEPDTPLEVLVEVGTRLLEDTDYYQSVVQHASEQLKTYNYTASAERLGRLVATYRHTRSNIL